MNDELKAARQENSPPVHWASLSPNFLWGASTSAYQIEGATHEDGRGSSIWDDFAATPGKTHQGETGDIANDHYHRMEDDVALMAEMGLNAYCFSIAWPRVVPEGQGTVNKAGLDFYDRLVNALLAKGITPVVKLYHWDLPSALQNRGGWLNRDTAHHFADYAEIVAQRLGDRVNWWITHNEPWCTSYLGHVLGIHAPGIQNELAGLISGHHVLLSHGLAVPRIRTHTRPKAQIGITLDIYPMHAVDDSPETRAAIEQADMARNRWFLEPLFKKCYPARLFADAGPFATYIQAGDFEHIATPIDFLGLNYYSRWVIRGKANGTDQHDGPHFELITPVPGSKYTETGWEIYPEGLLEALERLHREYAPPAILITESGAAFPDQWDGDGKICDPQRAQYLREHIHSVGRAVAQGIPVRGYFAWSLMDNYEWAEGYSKRFGVVYVDFPTQKRVIKESGQWYASFITSLKMK